MSLKTSRVLAVLFVFAASFVVESLHAADARHPWTSRDFLDFMSGAESSSFDGGPDAQRIALPVDGEYLVFTRNSYQRIAEDITVWSGKNVQGKDVNYLYVARNGGDASIKLAKGDFEYDIIRDSSGDYELRATDLRNTVADDCLAYTDQQADSDASQEIGTTAVTTLALAQPLEITVNLAYTRAALANFPSETALKNQFVIGLSRTNAALKNSNLNVRVKLGRVVFVKEYGGNTSLKLVREDVEDGDVPGLPVPQGKNKTVLVVGVTDKFAGTAMLGGPYIVIRYHAISTLTFVHEMGHSFGATHLKAYRFPNGRYTVMLQDGRGLREPIYSNPTVEWLGKPAGTSTLFNAKRMCREFFKLGPACWIRRQ